MIKVAKIKNGYVRGTAAADPRIISFKGIPYAQPPVGENQIGRASCRERV